MPLIPVILCGGSGTRLWPLSRSSYPKQFVEFTPGTTLFQETLKRVQGLGISAPPIVVCNQDHRFFAKKDMDSCGCKGTVITEPVARNTAPAIALAAFEALKSNPDAVLLVLPSDHSLKGKEEFRCAVQKALRLAQQDRLVTFGIQPTHPDTGFGYIARGKPLGTDGYAVESFVEKPPKEKAETMLAMGGYYWNSGMFVFQAKTYLEELKRFSPKMHAQCEKAMRGASKQLAFVSPDAAAMKEAPADSIDYAVMEKTSKTALVPLNVVWNDLGSWNAMHAIASKDTNDNTVIGNVLLIDSQNSYLHSTSRLIAAVGLRELAVIETKDAVLVSTLSQVQRVKNIAETLRAENSDLSTTPPVVQKPWGSYESLAKGKHYQCKRLVINPGQSLSLQLHHHRSEHWTVVEGEALIRIGDDEKTYTKDHSVYVPVGTMHRITNKTPTPIVIIEVQNGDYLGEDDIVRVSDLYARN